VVDAWKRHVHAADQYPAVGRAPEKGLPHGDGLFLILIEQNRRIGNGELDRHAVYRVGDNQNRPDSMVMPKSTRITIII